MLWAPLIRSALTVGFRPPPQTTPRSKPLVGLHGPSPPPWRRGRRPRETQVEGRRTGRSSRQSQLTLSSDRRGSGKFAFEGTVLEGGEEGVHFLQVGAAVHFELVDLGGTGRESPLEFHGEDRNRSFRELLDVQSWL